MALIERLMGLEEPKIPVHAFFAAAQEIIMNRLTVAQVKTFLAMDAAAQAEMDAIIATAPPAAQTANRALWIHSMHSIFLLAEDQYPQYSTPAEVRAKLGI